MTTKKPKTNRIKISIRSSDGHYVDVNVKDATEEMLSDAYKLADFLSFGVKGETK